MPPKVARSATLSFPYDDAALCLSSDASDRGWTIALTQAKIWKENVPPPSLIACSSDSLVSLSTLINANLVQIVCSSEAIKTHRWAMKFAGSRYTIENVSERTFTGRISLPGGQSAVFSELLGTSFEDREGTIYVEGKLWIPRQAKDLIVRVLQVAHGGVEAHREIQVMENKLKEHFAIDNFSAVVSRFVGQCLLCKHIKGGKSSCAPGETLTQPWCATSSSHRLLSDGDTYGTTR
ncbi:hypothetical protein PHMEG_0004548 [Phytophthora megakarya]|uniref:Integrase zinc-binding domain-containing protein n=1 Tax=Phytophthora megakarya TaxID=4795 RepID=A0A225WV82_9STRA|nr:hypothetical protein PHMEG_0004548 [Phytophthora megakarya]